MIRHERSARTRAAGTGNSTVDPQSPYSCAQQHSTGRFEVTSNTAWSKRPKPGGNVQTCLDGPYRTDRAGVE